MKSDILYIEKYCSIVPELKNTPDVRQMLHSEKLDFTGVYEFKNGS